MGVCVCAKLCECVYVQRGLVCLVALYKNSDQQNLCALVTLYACVCVQEGLSIHTHNDMQMILSQSDANGFIITKNINTVKIKLQT